jgi:hypothetical protein
MSLIRTGGDRMRQDHTEVFFDAAQQYVCWIGLREPNPLADRWIGTPGYIPKGENCKAKTADNPNSQFAGLVVDPILRPEAFKSDTRSAAVDTWKNKFLRAGRLPPGFACVQTGPDRGPVRFSGSAIFADYDLMAISRSDTRGEWLPTSQAQQKELFAKIEPFLKKGLRVSMIQHPTEFMWTGGVGAREMEWVLWFGPGRRFNRWLSSMPRAGH